jgi:hypothetical protein
VPSVAHSRDPLNLRAAREGQEVAEIGSGVTANVGVRSLEFKVSRDVDSVDGLQPPDPLLVFAGARDASLLYRGMSSQEIAGREGEVCKRKSPGARRIRQI